MEQREKESLDHSVETLVNGSLNVAWKSRIYTWKQTHMHTEQIQRPQTRKSTLRKCTSILKERDVIYREVSQTYPCFCSHSFNSFCLSVLKTKLRKGERKSEKTEFNNINIHVRRTNGTAPTNYQIRQTTHKVTADTHHSIEWQFGHSDKKQKWWTNTFNASRKPIWLWNTKAYKKLKRNVIQNSIQRDWRDQTNPAISAFNGKVVGKYK